MCGAVAGSAIALDCAAQSSDIRISVQIAHPSADCADPANVPNRCIGRLMKIVCISSSGWTFKITIDIFTGKNVNYPIVSSTSLNILIIITSNSKEYLNHYNKCNFLLLGNAIYKFTTSCISLQHFLIVVL